MQEYFFANYRLLTEESIASRRSARDLANFTAPMPYTHTFQVREGDAKDVDAKRAWALGCPVAFEYESYTVHDTDGGWAFVCKPEGGRPAKWIHSLVLCSRDYSDMTVYAAGMKKNDGRPGASGRTLDLLRLAVNAGIDRHDGIALHASLVEKDGFGVVFLGPSGVGKSTQAKLWEQVLGAEYLSEDRPCLRRICGEWYGFGMPWWGNEIFRPDSVPVRALVLLSQAKENRIEPMNPAQTLAALLKQVILPVWDKATMNAITVQLAALALERPFYHLYCQPDEAAVRLAFETIQGNGAKL